MELNLLKRLVAVDSTTNTAKEADMAKELCAVIGEDPWFKEHPDMFGMVDVPGDALGRKNVWALRLADDPAAATASAVPTVVLAGHMDTVTTANFEGMEAYSRDPEALEEAFRKQGAGEAPVALPMKAWTKDDLASGEWIFGRGTADMKGGMSVYLDQLFQGAKDKNLLFIAACDEETYSVGMRAAANLMVELKERFDLDYKLLFMGESHLRDERGSVYFDGTIGKMTVNIVVRGIPSHVRFYYGANNAILLASQLCAAIDGNAALTERYKTEVTPPPSVSYFRDTKPRYDVTLAESVDMSLVQFLFRKSPAKAMEDLVSIAKQVAADNQKRIREQYELWKGDLAVNCTPLSGETEVLTFGELKTRVKGLMGPDFDAWYDAEVEAVVIERNAGTCSMNDATNRLVHALLNKYKTDWPLVVIALAPPMYPGFTNADFLPEDHMILGLPDLICEFCREELGYEAYFDHYFGGIADMSYAACIYGAEESAVVGENMPLWGSCYNIDFDAIRKLQIPVFNIGPFGRDIHTGQERANKKSLMDETPRLIRYVIDQIQ
ncbi:MAG: M20/M25/M40 family metallo-hydrolase [Firmicutes bacterium]|nr:M20/M25/M40 family metallo-hydrolase [Bacillota bacterium]